MALHTQCEMPALRNSGRADLAASQCRYAAERLARSRMLTGGVWTPVCRQHLDYLAQRDPDAATRPLNEPPLNQPPLRQCPPAPERRRELVAREQRPQFA
jgi:hypothetical protein